MREISAAAERARGKLREEFDQLRVGIEKLRAEGPDGEGQLLAVSDGAESAREKLREEFDQLRVGIEKLQAKGKR
jgi:predicted  nucleic acid-binding Zn-ribbon protein